MALFAALDAAQREQLSRVAADVSLAAGEYAAARGRRSRAVRGPRGPDRAHQARRRDRARARRASPGRRVRGGPDRARDGLPGGLPCGGAVARDADRAPRLPRSRGGGAGYRQGGRPARRAPDGRIARAAGARGAATSAGDRRGTSLGPVLRRAAALPGPQPGHVQVAHARYTGCRGRVGRSPAGRGGLAGDPHRRRQDGDTATAPPRGGAARPRHRGDGRRVRHRDRRRGAGGPGRRRLRSLGGPEDDRRRAGGARRPGRHLGPDRELSRLPARRVRGRAGEPRASAGAETRCRDPRHALDPADRRCDPRAASRRRRRPARADDHPRLRSRVAATVDRRVRPPRREGHLVRRSAQRGAERPRPRHPYRRCRQLGRAGRAVLLDPRTERDDRLPQRKPREEDVALSHRADRDAAEHPHHRSAPR